MTTETDAIQMAIEAWQATRPEGAYPRFQIYKSGNTFWTRLEWASEDYLAELLEEEWDSANLDGDELELSRPGYSVSLTWAADPSGGRKRAAYLGASSGFEWEDETVASDALEAVLRYCMWDADALAEFGLASCEDYLHGDDGGFWLVADAARFERAWRLCRGAQHAYEEQEREPVAEEVIEMLKVCVDSNI